MQLPLGDPCQPNPVGDIVLLAGLVLGTLAGLTLAPYVRKRSK